MLRYDPPDQLMGDQYATNPRKSQGFADGLRVLRGVEVLERVDTPEAEQLLRGLAKGAPGVRLTRETRADLDRLSSLR